jgi:mono/diheme cytochrome c family protein
MKRQRILSAAAGVGLAIAAVIGLEITASTDSCAAEPNQAKKLPPQNSQSKMSFQEDVLPILVGRCLSCHQPGAQGTQASGLDLSSYASIMKGTKFGPMIIPGDPESSNLMLLLDWRASPELRMPLGKKQLSSCDRNAIRSWIREGAKDN